MLNPRKVWHCKFYFVSSQGIKDSQLFYQTSCVEANWRARHKMASHFNWERCDRPLIRSCWNIMFQVQLLYYAFIAYFRLDTNFHNHYQRSGTHINNLRPGAFCYGMCILLHCFNLTSFFCLNTLWPFYAVSEHHVWWVDVKDDNVGRNFLGSCQARSVS